MAEQHVFDIIHNRTGAGYTDVEARIDASGKQFLAVSVAPNAENTNITQIELYIAAAGAPFPQAPDHVFTTPAGQGDKIDAVALERSGRDLIVYGATHAPGAGNRALHVVAKKLLNVFDTNPQFEAESNGRGAEVIPAGSGGGGGGDVDYDLIRAIVRDELGLREGEDSLISQYAGAAPAGSSTVRKGLQEKGINAVERRMAELLDVTRHDTDQYAGQYQDRLFDFTKNAAANPLANVLGGKDPWGRLRQEELRTIIKECVREVLDEGEEGIPTEPTNGGTQ